MPTIPAQPGDLGVPWLQDMFTLNGLSGSAFGIASFAQKRIGTGQIGQNMRITFTYDSPIDASAAGAPRNWSASENSCCLARFGIDRVGSRGFPGNLDSCTYSP